MLSDLMSPNLSKISFSRLLEYFFVSSFSRRILTAISAHLPKKQTNKQTNEQSKVKFLRKFLQQVNGSLDTLITHGGNTSQRLFKI